MFYQCISCCHAQTYKIQSDIISQKCKRQGQHHTADREKQAFANPYLGVLGTDPLLSNGVQNILPRTTGMAYGDLLQMFAPLLASRDRSPFLLRPCVSALLLIRKLQPYLDFGRDGSNGTMSTNPMHYDPSCLVDIISNAQTISRHFNLTPGICYLQPCTES